MHGSCYRYGGGVSAWISVDPNALMELSGFLSTRYGAFLVVKQLFLELAKRGRVSVRVTTSTI